MTILARLQVTPSADRRHAPRRELCLGSSLTSTGDEVIIHDLSSTGMLIETAAKLAPFDDLQIELPEAGTTHAFVVWTSGRFYGCEFRDRLSRAALSASQLRSRPDIPVEAPPLAVIAPATEEEGLEDLEPFAPADEKAPLTTRLRVILGSAIILWALIIWAVASIVQLLASTGG